MTGYIEGAVLALLCLDRLISFIRFRTNGKKSSNPSTNPSNNPHATPEYVHEAIDKRTAELKVDVKDIKKKLTNVCIDVGILMARDSSLRSRRDDR